MTPTKTGTPQDDDRCLSFGQLLLLIGLSCGMCLALARLLGMGWLPSIAFAYVGGAAMVIVLCLIILQLWDGASRRADRGADPAAPDETVACELRLPTWHTGKTIDKHRRSPDVI